MNSGEINFEEIKKDSAMLLASADEAAVGAKQLNSLMETLCQKNDAPALKRASDSLIETITNFVKAIKSEMESVTDMANKAEKLQNAMS